MATAPSSVATTQTSLPAVLPNRWHRLLLRLHLRRANEPLARFECGLGVDGLPDDLGQLSNGAPVALLMPDALAKTTWLHALLADMLSGGPVVLLAQEQAWLDHLLEHAPLRRAYDQGQMTLFLLRPDFPQRLLAHGLQPVFDELEGIGLSPWHSLFVMASNHWLLEPSVPELQRLAPGLQQWCSRHQRPVVFGFYNGSSSDATMVRLVELFGWFHHIARLDGRSAQPSLTLERWSGKQGAVLQAHYGLRIDERTGRLTYDGSQIRNQTQQLVQAPDQFDVIATAAALGPQTGLPPHWQVVAKFDDVEAALSHGIAATVLLHSGNASEFAALARLVHRLRLSHPRSLKIIVRETNGKLRTHLEQALRRLGANRVVYREVGFSRLLQLLQENNQQIYSASVNPDFERALATFMPDAIRGYRPPKRFVPLVRATLERTSGLAIKHSFVRLHLLPHVPQTEAVLACAPLRDGDLLTADRNALLVFLFACDEPDVDQALNRFFTKPLAQLFSSQICDSTEVGIHLMLDQLEEEIRAGLPDCTLCMKLPAEKLALTATATAPDLPDCELCRHPPRQLAPEPGGQSSAARSVVSILPTKVPLTKVAASASNVMPVLQPKAIARRTPQTQSTGNTA